MNDNNNKIQIISNDFVQINQIRISNSYTINNQSIIINSGKLPIVKDIDLNSWESSIFNDIKVIGPAELIQINFKSDNFSRSTFNNSEIIIKNWSHVYEIFPLEHLKNIKLWRSNKTRIGKNEYNLWYAAAGTNCGLHNEHKFLELHTQISGVGRMQKFKENSIKSLYEEVFMAPGYTHKPFYDTNGNYPWHQYKADTDCIWLATEFYD